MADIKTNLLSKDDNEDPLNKIENTTNGIYEAERENNADELDDQVSRCSNLNESETHEVKHGCNKDGIQVEIREEIKQYRKKSSYLKYNKNLFDGTKTAIKKLWCVVFVCILFIIAEVAGGLIASSLAILSDAVHLGSDLFGFAISIIAMYLSQKDATARYTYGYNRAEI